MSTENNNTSDWTLEDCQSYINLLYPNRTSNFKEKRQYVNKMCKG